ncbi:hypothetical protein AJ78_01475 [Emergomyces pasteurianus Ep9510]|uniref:Uncharacterized protein n=1 Tax=Emergomyces pasteurianus Ep9510 TaxID=1447872 RepID=A0A1J9PQK8_9EURO|nr:hypothetical protein AJ78_01475 [Emergomyces pasteurianus Ep9510]
MHISLAVVSLGLFGLSHAQKSMVTVLPFPGPVEQQPVVASVIKADPTKTIYALQCAEGTDDTTECFVPSMTYTRSPPDMVGVDVPGYEEDDRSRLQIDCKLQGASALCTVVFKVSQEGKSWVTLNSETTPVPTSGFITPWTVTITAGLEKLEGATATPAPPSGVETGATQTGNAPPTGTNVPTTKPSIGVAAMPLVSAAANWGAIGGAAVAVAALVI